MIKRQFRSKKNNIPNILIITTYSLLSAKTHQKSLKKVRHIFAQ